MTPDARPDGSAGSYLGVSERRPPAVIALEWFRARAVRLITLSDGSAPVAFATTLEARTELAATY